MDAITVVIDSAGQLGTVSSSQRYKEDIQDMGEASASLLELRPVTFRYKKASASGEKPIRYGLIAEEVLEVFPELVAFDEEGQPETVLYRLLAPMLLNELQKHERTIASQEAELAEFRATKVRVGEQEAIVRELHTRLTRLEVAEVAVLRQLEASSSKQVDGGAP